MRRPRENGCLGCGLERDRLLSLILGPPRRARQLNSLATSAESQASIGEIIMRLPEPWSDCTSDHSKSDRPLRWRPQRSDSSYQPDQQNRAPGHSLPSSSHWAVISMEETRQIMTIEGKKPACCWILVCVSQALIPALIFHPTYCSAVSHWGGSNSLFLTTLRLVFELLSLLPFLLNYV